MSTSEAATAQAASCTDGGGHVWKVRSVWGVEYAGRDGVRRVTNDATAITSADPAATTVDYSMRIYTGSGALLQTLRENDRAFNFAGGSLYLTRNLVNPPAQSARARVVVSVGDGNDGYGNCVVSLFQPADGTLKPSPSPTPIPSPTPSPTVGSKTPFRPTSGRPFGANSPFNMPLPANPVLDANSKEIVSYLSGGTRGQIANLYDYGWPIFHADATTPRQRVTATMGWGPDPFAGDLVPIPANLTANAGSDGHALVVDWSTGRAYEFWQLRKVSANSWSVSWGQVTPDVFGGIGNERLNGGSSKGSGMSGLAGLVRAHEVRSGNIDHALEFASSGVTPNVFRFPANKTDGSNLAGIPLSMTIPEGARIRLDPTVNLAAIPGITPGELAVGRALQKYGAFCSDQSGARLSFRFENTSQDALGDPYPKAGFEWDYYHMSHIPWEKLQVLRQWDGK